MRENTSPISVCGLDYQDVERRCWSGGENGDDGDHGDEDGMGTFGPAVDVVACPSGTDGDYLSEWGGLLRRRIVLDHSTPDYQRDGGGESVVHRVQ